MFLTLEELKQLTGYEVWGWQRKWLTAHGWKFEVASDGRPIVLADYAREKLSDPLIKETKRRPVPNLAAIK